MDADRPEDRHHVRGHHERGARVPDGRADQSRGHEAQDDEVHEDRGPEQLAERQLQRPEARDPLKIKGVHLFLTLHREQGHEAAPQHEHERLRRQGDAEKFEPPHAPGAPMGVCHRISNRERQHGADHRDRHDPVRPQLGADVANQFRVGRRDTHVTSPLDSPMTTFSSVSPTGSTA